jgi:putative membrane protein
MEHLFFFWMELFAWETVAKKVFKGSMPDELFHPTRKMAANQGLYNGFLSAGLIWSLFIQNPAWKNHVALFFLICILIAGLYGAYSVSKKIFLVQGLPALITILVLCVTRMG